MVIGACSHGNQEYTQVNDRAIRWKELRSLNHLKVRVRIFNERVNFYKHVSWHLFSSDPFPQQRNKFKVGLIN